MAAMSNYLENKLTDQIFRGQAYSFPSTLHFALFTVAPTDAGGGTEVTGGSYARAAINATWQIFSGTRGLELQQRLAAALGITSNNVAITFPAPTANWGTVVALGIFDASSGGNMLFHGLLTAQNHQQR